MRRLVRNPDYSRLYLVWSLEKIIFCIEFHGFVAEEVICLFTISVTLIICAIRLRIPQLEQILLD